MNALRRFFRFWYDFIIADDWVVAAGIVLALAATAGLAAGGLSAWWLLPVAVVGLLVFSLWRGIRGSA